MISQGTMLEFVREALGFSQTVRPEISALQGRGSDRVYYRVTWKEDTAILVHYDPKRVENTYHAEIAQFLYEIDVPVPRLIRHDAQRCLILMQDLGERDLFSFREEGWETRRALYRQTLIAVHRLHSFPEDDFPTRRVRLMESFGPDLYRWERDYFMDHFVRGVCRIPPEASFKRELEKELSALADRLAGPKRALVHRDLQSQNVMIHDGKIYLIDFQGMRFGNRMYDLGSLLCDPYVNLSDQERDELLPFYYGLSRQEIDYTAFRNSFWEASVQRLMQALGAYGFLSLKKGLSGFLEHIPAGLRNLQHAAEHASTLPRLSELLRVCVEHASLEARVSD